MPTRMLAISDGGAFAEVDADRDPVNLDSNFAAETISGRLIAQGILGAGLVSTARI
jgi:acyl dehydratase